MKTLTSKDVSERLEGLRLGRSQLIEELRHQEGAIADCEHWLKTLEEQPVESNGSGHNDTGA